jgi:uncharacterized lipoprotein
MKLMARRSMCVVVLLGACAAAPQSHEVRRTTLIRLPGDAVWQGLIAEVAEQGWSVATMDRASGFMATNWLRVPERLADCGSAPMATIVQTQVRLNVVVTATDGATNFTVNTTFRQVRRLGDVTGVVSCYSTGRVESVAAEHVTTRAKAFLDQSGSGGQDAPGH